MSEDEARLITANCPACGALLRNVQAAPGVSVRCLNCGRRFTPEPARSTGSLPVDAHAPEGRAASSPPRSPGYWLLRIPAAVASLASLAIVPYILYEIAKPFILYGTKFSGFRRPLEALTLGAYVPLVAWSAWALLFLARALARVDSGVTYVAWRAGALNRPLPAAPGSSLPYIAPVAALGGVGVPLTIAAGNGGSDSLWITFLLGVCGGTGFYLGFMLEDVRQFCWRQEQLARACFRAAGGRSKRGPEVLSGCRWLLSGAVLLVALAIFFVVLDHLRYDRGENLIPLFFSFAFVGIAYSLLLLGRDWDLAVAWWQMAAAQRSAARKGNTADSHVPTASSARPGWGRRILVFGLLVVAAVLWFFLNDAVSKGEIYRDAFQVFREFVLALSGAALAFVVLVVLAKTLWRGAMLWQAPTADLFCKFPRVWVLYGAVWVVLMLTSERGGPSGFDLAGFLCACGAAAAFAFWLSVFLSQVCRWRMAQEACWPVQEAEVQAKPPQAPRWQFWIVWGAVLLALVQAGLFSLMMSSTIRSAFSTQPRWFWWRFVAEVLGFPLVLAILHYPTMWCAMLLREFLALERFYETKRQALSPSEDFGS